MSSVEEDSYLDALERSDPELAGLGRDMARLRRQLEKGDDSACTVGDDSAWIGPYRVGRTLGDGAASMVVEAFRDGDPLSPVAIKIVQPWIQSPKLLRRFATEMAIVRALDHPNFVPVVDHGVTSQGRPWFAMELVRGEHADRYVRVRQLSLDRRIALMANICRAVEHAHVHGVIHRDLKPSNILIEHRDPSGGHVLPDGPNAVDTPRIVDFGLARSGDPALDGQRSESLAAPAGTLTYMAPEQAVFEGRIDARTDVFGLGGVLFAMVAGAPPMPPRLLDRLSPEELYRWIREQPRPRLSAGHGFAELDGGLTSQERRSTLFKGVGRIAAKALEIDCENRYQSAAALADDLDRLRAEQPIRAPAPSRVRDAMRFVRRHRALVAIASAVALALLVGIGLALHSARAARASERVAQRNLDIARRVVADLVVPLDLLLAIAPGLVESRHDLLIETTSSLEQLAGEMPEDVEIRRLLASLLATAGRTLGDPSRANLGRVPDALVALERAEKLAVGLLEELPEDTEMLAALGAIRKSRGNIDGHRRLDGAVGWYELAREPLQCLVALRPDDGWARTQVLHIDRLIAARHQRARESAEEGVRTAPSVELAEASRREAATAARQAEWVAERALATFRAFPLPGDSLALLIQRADELVNLASVFVDANLPPRAAEILEEACALCDRLVAESPQDPHCALLAGSSHRYAAQVAAQLGDFDEACDRIRRSMASFDRVIELEPGTYARIDATSVPRRLLAQWEEQAGRIDRALEAGAAAIRAARDCCARDPANHRVIAELWEGLRSQSARLERAAVASDSSGERAARANEAVLLAEEALDLTPNAQPLLSPEDAGDTSKAMRDRIERMRSLVP